VTRRIGAFGRETFASLRVRNFRLFFGGQLISQTGNWMTLVAQTLLVLHLTGSGIALGLLAAAQFGPVLLLGPWAGLVADRSDKRRLLLVVQSLAMVQSFLLAVVAFTGAPVWTVYAVALMGGVTIAFDNPARRSFVVEMVPQADVPNAVSLNSALMTSSRVVGPAVAGVLVATVGFGWAFLADAVSYTAVLGSLWLIRSRDLRVGPVASRRKGQVRAGLRYVAGVTELRVPLVMMAVIGTLAFNFSTVLPLYVTRDLGGSEALFTVVFTVLSVGSFVSALAVARRTSVGVRTVAMAALGFAAAMLLLAVARGSGLARPAAFLVGLTSVGFLTSSTALVQLRAAPQMRGRVLALQAMLFLGSTPIGGPIVGWLAQTHGPRWALGVGAVACLGAGLWGLRSVRRDSTTDPLALVPTEVVGAGDAAGPGDRVPAAAAA
jgi:MFS family permease